MKKDRAKQVKTTKEKSPYGKEHYKIIGKKGGDNSPTKYTSETGKLSAQIRWDKFKEIKDLKE